MCKSATPPPLSTHARSDHGRNGNGSAPLAHTATERCSLWDTYVPTDEPENDRILGVVSTLCRVVGDRSGFHQRSSPSSEIFVTLSEARRPSGSRVPPVCRRKRCDSENQPGVRAHRAKDGAGYLECGARRLRRKAFKTILLTNLNFAPTPRMVCRRGKS